MHGPRKIHVNSLETWLGFVYHSWDPGSNPLATGAKLYIDGELLTHAVIPESVTRINQFAFAFCDTLEEVTFYDVFIDIDETVHFPGSEEEAEFLRSRIPQSSNRWLLDAHWETWGPLKTVAPRNGYLILAPGESHDLKLEIPDEYLERVMWITTNGEGAFVPDSEVISVDRETGTVTALTKGTAGAVALLYSGTDILMARFRIDVTEAQPAAEIESIRTTGTKATVRLYSLGYAEIPIIPVLAQNNTSSGSALIPEGDTGAEATGAAVSSARFVSEKAAAVFDLVVKDDRTLQIVPKYEALEAAQASSKNIAGTYKSKIEITVGTGSDARTYILKKGTGEVTYTLTVKQTKPSVTATAGKINSLVSGHEVPIKLKGNVTAIELNPAKTSSADIAVDLANRTVRLSDTSTLTKGTRTVYLLATVKGWAVKVPVTLKVSVAATKPTIKLGKTSLTVTSGTIEGKVTTVKATPASYADESRYELRVAGITEDGVPFPSDAGFYADIYEGKISVGAPSLNGTHTYKVKIGLYDRADPETPIKTATLTVKTKAASTVSMTLKATGAIDLAVPGSPAKITATFTNYKRDPISYAVIGVFTDKGVDVSGQFSYAPSYYTAPVVIRAAEGNTLTPGTYKVLVKAYIGPPPEGSTENRFVSKVVKITVKKSKAADVPVSVTAKATGSIDVLKAGTAVTIRPAVKNWYGEFYTNLVITKTYDSVTKKTVNEPANDLFDVGLDFDSSDYVVEARPGVNHKDKFTYRIVAEVNGQTYKSKAATLNVKQSAVKLAPSVKTGTLYKDDGFDFVEVDLGFDITVYKGVDPARTVLDAASAKYFDLTYRYDGTFEIGFKDNVPCAAGTKTVKIKVFMYGNETNTPNKTVSVKITVK